VPEREAFPRFLEAEKRVPAGLLMEAVGTEGTKENRPGTLYASDVEHELIPTPEWKPGERVRSEAYSGVKLCTTVYSAEMLTGTLVAEAVVRVPPPGLIDSPDRHPNWQLCPPHAASAADSIEPDAYVARSLTPAGSFGFLLQV